MANTSGKKWNKGGKLARGQSGIDFSQFGEFIEKLDAAGENVQQIITDVMTTTAEDIQVYVKDATQKRYLPAKGKYSNQQTENAIIPNPAVQWSGTTGSVGYGFDKTKPNAGTFLIKGTPKMRPDYELEKIFTNKRFMRERTDEIFEYFTDEIWRDFK